MKNQIVKSSNLKQMAIVMGLIILGLNAHGQSIQRAYNADGTAQRSSNNSGTRQALRISGHGTQRDELSPPEQQNTGGQVRLSSNSGRSEWGKPKCPPYPIPWCGNDPYWRNRAIYNLEREIDTIKHILSLDIDDRSIKYLTAKLKELESRLERLQIYSRRSSDQDSSQLSLSDLNPRVEIGNTPRIIVCGYPLFPYYWIEREIAMIKHILSLDIDDRSIKYLTAKLKELETQGVGNSRSWKLKEIKNVVVCRFPLPSTHVKEK